MLPALRLRPRASCLTWRRVERHGLLQTFRQASNGRSETKKPKQERLKEQDSGRSADVDKAKNIALLVELFPEEAQRHGERVPREREVPRLTLDLPDIPDMPKSELPSRRAGQNAAPALPLDRAAFWGNHNSTQKAYRRLERQGEFISVLVLRNATKDLTDEDFRRVIPQGKHLEGWNLERGDILKVIPGRDTATLERKNFYFLLFKSPVSAFAYQTHVTRLHKLSQIHTPSSLMSPIPPPPGFTMEGEDINAMLQSYSLLPPSQNIQIRSITPPYVWNMQQMIKYQGYPAIVNRPNRSPAEVLLRLEGQQLTIPNIRSALSKAARDRGMPWTGEEGHHLSIQKWEMGERNVSSFSKRRHRPFYDGKNEVEEEKRDGEEDGESSGNADLDAAVDDEPTGFQRLRRYPPPAYIIGFQNEAEAQTFVRFWHRRHLELANFDYDGDMAPTVDAEILW